MNMPSLETLNRLRQRFLTPHPEGLADYWDSNETLAAYHATFARRIGWKWDAVAQAMAEGSSAGRIPLPRAGAILRVLDWGCGSGAASLAIAQREQDADFAPFLAPGARWFLHDRSARAMAFAKERLLECLPALASRVETIARISPESHSGRDSLLLVSHVLTELSVPQRADLAALAAGAGAVLWVEPGTPFCASALVRVREDLRAAGFVPSLPCPHAGACGMLREQPEANWCHFFAEPPRAVFQDGAWVKLAKALGIDLRALPVSFLFLVHESIACSATGEPREADRDALILARPRAFKGHTALHVCDEGGISQRDFQHKSDKSFARELESPAFLRTFPSRFSEDL